MMLTRIKILYWDSLNEFKKRPTRLASNILHELSSPSGSDSIGHGDIINPCLSSLTWSQKLEVAVTKSKFHGFFVYNV